MSSRNEEISGGGTNISAGKRLQKTVDEAPKISTESLLNTKTPLKTAQIASPILARAQNPGTAIQESTKHNAAKLSAPAEASVKRSVPAGKNDISSTLESALDSTLVQACATAEHLEDSRKECQRLQKLNVELRKDLRDAQDFIFSLQRREQSITESEAGAEFNSLCMVVENWVQTKLGEALEKGKAKMKPKLPAERIRTLLSFIPQPGKEAFQYPDTDEYNIIAMIIRFLCLEIFETDFYCPVEKGALGFLAGLEQSMRELEPRRDLITVRSWHSETYTAMTKRPQFTQIRRSHSQKLAAELATMLQLFLPRQEWPGLAHSILTTIIEPALNLAHMMHLSINEFSFQYTSYCKTKAENRKPLPKESSPFDCVAISPPGKQLKFPILDGTITYLFDLSPELICRAVKTDAFAEPRVLKKARVLVAVAKENNLQYGAPAPRLKEPLTVLGWMDECLRPKAHVSGVQFF